MKKKLMVAFLAASLMVPGRAEAGFVESANKKIKAVGGLYSKVSPADKVVIEVLALAAVKHLTNYLFADTYTKSSLYVGFLCESLCYANIFRRLGSPKASVRPICKKEDKI
jgi:hypothetical protein